MNLLIIDLRIKSINIILESLNIYTNYILLDFENDTEKSLISKIESLNINSFNSIGILRIGKYEKYYQLFSKSEECSLIKLGNALISKIPYSSPCSGQVSNILFISSWIWSTPNVQSIQAP